MVLGESNLFAKFPKAIGLFDKVHSILLRPVLKQQLGRVLDMNRYILDTIVGFRHQFFNGASNQTANPGLGKRKLEMRPATFLVHFHLGLVPLLTATFGSRAASIDRHRVGLGLGLGLGTRSLGSRFLGGGTCTWHDDAMMEREYKEGDKISCDPPYDFSRFGGSSVETGTCVVDPSG